MVHVKIKYIDYFERFPSEITSNSFTFFYSFPLFSFHIKIWTNYDHYFATSILNLLCADKCLIEHKA